MDVEVTIEIPKGQRNKYEVDHATGRIRLDRMLFTSTRYSSGYGFIEDTLADHGDPLAALACSRSPPSPAAHHLPGDRDDPDPGRERQRQPGAARTRPSTRGGAHAGHRRRARVRPVEIQHLFESTKELEPRKMVGCAALATLAGSVTSSLMGSARTACAASAAAPGSRAVRITVWPSSASWRQTSRPMPRLPP